MDKRKKFELLAKVESELAKRADSLGILTLSEAERTYLLGCWAKGALDCNGFAYFFAGPCDAEATALAFEELGFYDAADACRRAVAELPNGKPIQDFEQLTAWVKQQGEPLIERWNGFCKPIWDISSEQFDEALAKFIRKHKDGFDLKLDISPLL